MLKKNWKVTFIHPDLGIGGAERLILDVAIALSRQNVQVSFVTNHFNEDHAFEELKQKQFPVHVIGSWLPHGIFGRFQAFCAYMKMIYLSIIYVCFLCKDKPDLYFVDQIPIANLCIKLFGGKVIYYCHHPDLLASSHDSIMKRMYRAPIDWLEMFGVSKSNVLLVNSEYTSNVFGNTFPNIKIPRQILYPTISLALQEMLNNMAPKPIEELLPEINTKEEVTIFLSINRFHPAKNLQLAVDAMESLKMKISKSKFEKIYLILAGGYDPKSAINAKYFNELVNNVNEKNLNSNIIFLKSPTDSYKVDLLLACDCLIYTPINEHFGIVPIEAMAASKPVIACNSGGPCETVEDNVTGYLCKPKCDNITNAMYKILINKKGSIEMGVKGRERMEESFSYQRFCDNVMDVVKRVLDKIAASTSGTNC